MNGNVSFSRHPYQISQRAGYHLLHHVPTVNLKRDLSDAKPFGGLLIQKTRGHQGHDFALARGQA
jgi:hypothetical protein